MSKNVSIYDTGRAPSLWPVQIEHGHFTERTFAVTLPYVTARSILDHEFTNFLKKSEDPFPRYNYAGTEGRRMVLSETHDINSLARLRQSNHPQDAYLARAEAVLNIALQKAEAGLPQVNSQQFTAECT